MTVCQQLSSCFVCIEELTSISDGYAWLCKAIKRSLVVAYVLITLA